MQQEDNSRAQEGDFEDETCNRCVKRITRLQALIEFEEAKLFKAMQDVTKLKAHF